MTSGRATEKETKSFAFDKSYWCVSQIPCSPESFRPGPDKACRSDMLIADTALHCRSACPKDDPSYASQQTLFDDLGRDLLEHAFEGYNTTVFACESNRATHTPYLSQAT